MEKQQISKNANRDRRDTIQDGVLFDEKG